MLSRSSKRAECLASFQSLSKCQLNTPCIRLPQRQVIARFHRNSRPGKHSRPGRKSRQPWAQNETPERHPATKKKSKPRRVELDVPFLGKPADVVVVNDKTLHYRPKKRTRRAQSTAGADEMPTLLAEYEQDKRPFDITEVSGRIDSLRSQYQPGHRLAPDDFEELQNRLITSFTIPQLQEYVSNNWKGGIIDLDSSSKAREHPNSSEWRPGTSQFLETGSIYQETIGERIIAMNDLKKPKERSAARILRDIWQLGIVQETGQLDVRLPAHFLTLLVNSEFFSFEDLASQYDAAIDLTGSLGLVRITGKQGPCESIRDMIVDYTNRIASQRLNLLPPDDPRLGNLAQTFTPKFLSWVETTYQVALTYEQGSSPIPTRLYYLSAKRVEADNARRTLNLALYNTMLPTVPFSTYMPASGLSEIHEANVEEGGSWHDRQKPWFRWRTPVGQHDWTRIPSYVSNEHQSTLSVELLKLLRQAPGPEAWLTHRAPGINIRESITASIGKSLFLRKPFLEGKEVSAPQLGQLSLPRTFVKDVPAASLIRNLKRQVTDLEHRVRRFRLVPTAIHAHVYPPLDLELVTDRKASRTTVRSAEAVLAENHVDYLLPESSADIRFTRRLTYELRAEGEKNKYLDALTHEIRDLITENLATNRETPLPTFQSMTVPNFLLQNTERNPGGTSFLEYMYEPSNDLQGALLHQFKAREHTVLFSSVDGGPYNPTTITNLSTELYPQDEHHAVTPTAPFAQIEQEEFGPFYNTACAVAHELDLSY